MKRASFMLFILFLFCFTAAQIPSFYCPEKIDSLQKLLKNARGKEKADVLNGLALYLAEHNPDSGFRYASEALKLSEKLDYSKGKGIATFNFGNCYFFRMDIKNALENYHAALRILEPLESSSARIVANRTKFSPARPVAATLTSFPSSDLSISRV